MGLDNPWWFLDITRATVYKYHLQRTHLRTLQPHKIILPYSGKGNVKIRKDNVLK